MVLHGLCVERTQHFFIDLSACRYNSKFPYEVYGEVVIYHFLVWLIPYETWEVPVAKVLTLDALVMGDDFACDCVCWVHAVGCPLTSHQPYAV